MSLVLKLDGRLDPPPQNGSCVQGLCSVQTSRVSVRCPCRGGADPVRSSSSSSQNNPDPHSYTVFVWRRIYWNSDWSHWIQESWSGSAVTHPVINAQQESGICSRVTLVKGSSFWWPLPQPRLALFPWMSSNKPSLPVYLAAPPGYLLIIWDFFHRLCTFLTAGVVLTNTDKSVESERVWDAEEKLLSGSCLGSVCGAGARTRGRCDGGLQRGKNTILSSVGRCCLLWTNSVVRL